MAGRRIRRKGRASALPSQKAIRAERKASSTATEVSDLEAEVAAIVVYSTITGDTGTSTADAVDDSLSVTGAGGIVVDVTDDSVVVDATAIEDDIAAIDTRLTALEDGELRYEPLTNGDIANPELVFAAGDVIMVKVTN